MTRTEILKASIKSSYRQPDRANITPMLDSKGMPCTIIERKAYALKNILDNMPLHIDDDELIVGTRTFYKVEKKVVEDLQELDEKEINKETKDIGDDDVKLNLDDTDEGIHVKSAIPHYINEKDIKFFNDINEEFANISMFTPDYSFLINSGLDEVFAKLSKAKPTTDIQKGHKNAVLISFMGFRTLINRYQKYAVKLAKADRVETKRRIELMQIANSCQHIKHKPPRNFQEAVQLYWFAHLVGMIDSGNTVNYGKFDELLGSFYKDNDKDKIIVENILKKFGNELDITEKNVYNKSLILTGAITSEENGANMLTLAILDTFANLELTQPTISMYINPNYGERYFKKATKLSQQGINVIKYFNEPKFINDLKATGLSELDATRIDQNVLNNIDDKFYVAGSTDLTEILIDTIKNMSAVKATDLTAIMNEFKNNIKNDIALKVTNFYKIQTAVTTFATGNQKTLIECMKDELVAKDIARSFMSPLPFVSGLNENCLANSMDITWFGEGLKAYIYVLNNPVTAINSLSALKQHVFDEKTFSFTAIKTALEQNFKGDEKMRKALFANKYWGCGNIDYDLLAKEVIEFASMVTNSIQLPNNAKVYTYTNQDEPFSAGKNLQATPNGRTNEMPIAHCTLTKETSEALLAIEPQYKLGNFFTLDKTVAKEISIDLIKPFFKLGGHMYVPNKLDIKQLREAQKKPEKYPNLMVYYNNKFLKFIEADQPVQDDIINLVKNGM